MARFRWIVVAVPAIFIVCCFKVSSFKMLSKKAPGKNFRPVVTGGVRPTKRVHFVPMHAGGTRQAVTKTCGLTGDGVADPFGLSEQFNNQTGKRKKRDMEGVTGSVDLEERSFRMHTRLAPAFQKIVGGQDTTPTQICWQALVVSTTDSGATQTCGGVIVGSLTILTLAECLLDPNSRLQLPASSFTVVVGAINSGAPATDSQDPTGCATPYNITSGIINPNYDDFTADNDIAVITLTTAINIDAKPCACLLCLKSRQPAVGETCIVSGYGLEVDPSNGTGPNNPIPLKWVAETILDQTNGLCPVFQDPNTGALTNTTNFYCTSGPVGQDSCLGDQGGALTCYDPTTTSYYAAGLIAFQSDVCGAGNGDQNVKLVNYLEWILETATPGDVVISDGSVTLPPITTPSITTSPPITTSPSITTPQATTSGGTSLFGTTPPFSTFAPPTGPKQCGLPGNDAIDPFGIVGQFSGQSNSHKRRFRNGKDISNVQNVRPRPPVRRPFGGRASPRIIGGFEAAPAEICWQAFVVALLNDGASEQTCGGIIVGSQTILTTTGCLFDANLNPLPASSISVTVGAVDSGAPATNGNDPLGCAQTYQVQTSLINPQYVYNTNDNDIAILTLSTAIDIQNKVCACTLCLTDRVPAVNETCVMSGYGSEISDVSGGTPPPRDLIPLKWVTETVHQENPPGSSGGFCAVYQDPTTLATTNVTNFICTFGAIGNDECLGDNGGPLTCYNPTTSSYYAAGIISMETDSCGNGQGGQSTKIDNYLQWIADNSLPGDVFINVTGIVTLPTVATTTSTTPIPTTTTSTVTVTGTVTTASPATTAPTTTTATAPPSSTGCGIPGNGVVDPFNLLPQFASDGSLKKHKKAGVVTFFNGQRILGGTQAPPKEICWQIYLEANLANGNFQLCGGVIVGSQTILTAAHCVNDGGALITAANIQVTIGSDTYPSSADTSGCAQTVAVGQVIPHPQFDPVNFDNDIALLLLSSPINLAGSGGCFCPLCVTDQQPLLGETCVVSGYGQQTADDNAPLPAVTNLEWVTENIRTQAYDGSCAISGDPTAGTETDLNDFVCAGGQAGEDTCEGDNGGPLFCMNPLTSTHYLVGLTSFGTDPCGGTTGSQYTKVAAYLSFISANAPPGDVNITITGIVTTTIATPPTVATTVGTGSSVSYSTGSYASFNSVRRFRG